MSLRYGSTSGQALVEFAMVLTALVLLLMGMFDLGRGVYAYNVVSSAAREAARYAITRPTDVSGMRTRVLSGTTALVSSDITVSNPVCVPSDCSSGSALTVSVTYVFRPYTAFFATMNLVGRSTMTVE